MKQLIFILATAIILAGCAERKVFPKSVKEVETSEPASQIETSDISTAGDIETDSTEEDTSSSLDEKPYIDDIENISSHLTFVEASSNSARTNDGVVYSFSQKNWILSAQANTFYVKKFNLCLTAYNNAPVYQTLDNKFVGLDISSHKGTQFEYRTQFNEPYTLLGNNMVVNEENELYLVNWSQDRAITRDDFLYIARGKDAYDLPSGLVFYISNENVLSQFNTKTNLFTEMDYGVKKIYADMGSKIGGYAERFLYLTDKHVLHCLSLLDGAEHIDDYQFEGVRDFWIIDEFSALVWHDDNRLSTLGTFAGELDPYELDVPQNGISNILVVATLDGVDGDNLGWPHHDTHLIDGDGRIVVNEP